MIVYLLNERVDVCSPQLALQYYLFRMIPVLNDFEIPEALIAAGSKGHGKQ
jgi:hypothetical protein